MDYPYFLSCKVKKNDVMLYFKTSDTMVIVPTFKQLFSISENSTYNTTSVITLESVMYIAVFSPGL